MTLLLQVKKGQYGGVALLVMLVSGGVGCRSPEDTGNRLGVTPKGDRSSPQLHWTESLTGMEFVHLPAGEFQMGTPREDVGHEEQEVLHQVRISRPFYMGKFEVTQGEWAQVMGEKPSWFESCGSDCPVEQVNWLDSQEFADRLSQLTGERFRLPTEAEWEYACRAGTVTPFSTGRNLTTDQANYDGNYPYSDLPTGVFRETTTRVGSFPPNGFGLYDLHGNVWEWCEDWHCPYPQGTVIDPVGECDSELRVIRGGSWYFNADSARCGVRYTHRPQDLGMSLGLRLVREVPK